jgi:hypothetical protein
MTGWSIGHSGILVSLRASVSPDSYRHLLVRLARVDGEAVGRLLRCVEAGARVPVLLLSPPSS